MQVQAAVLFTRACQPFWRKANNHSFSNPAQLAVPWLCLRGQKAGSLKQSRPWAHKQTPSSTQHAVLAHLPLTSAWLSASLHKNGLQLVQINQRTHSTMAALKGTKAEQRQVLTILLLQQITLAWKAACQPSNLQTRRKSSSEGHQHCPHLWQNDF